MQDKDKLLDADAQAQSDNLAAIGFDTSTAKRYLFIAFVALVVSIFSYNTYQSNNREQQQNERIITLQKEKDQIVKEYLEYAKEENKFREKLLNENLAIQQKQNQINKELDKVKDQVEH